MKSITPTEKRILEMIAEGFSTPDVATSLEISKHTVLSHRRSLLRKFDVKNSAELVLRAIQTKVIDLYINDKTPNPLP